MKVLSSLLGVLVLCSCATQSDHRYETAQGDLGQFILDWARLFGGKPVATKNLPALAADWRYVQDRYGLSIWTALDRKADLQAFLQAAFGKSSSSNTYAIRDVGLAMYMQDQPQHVVLSLHPPITWRGMSERAREESLPILSEKRRVAE